jgi:hypothetical protein
MQLNCKVAVIPALHVQAVSTYRCLEQAGDARLELLHHLLC